MNPMKDAGTTHDKANDKAEATVRGTTGSKVQGEGDYEAARRYDEKTREHVKSHDIEQEARDAEPANRGEERDMERAEEIGKQRAKEEDPLLEHPENIGGAGEAGKGGGGKPPR
jgi:hypothetical protein